MKHFEGKSAFKLIKGVSGPGIDEEKFFNQYLMTYIFKIL